MRKIAVVSGSRSDLGLLTNLLLKIHLDPKLSLQFLITGQHVTKDAKLTLQEVNDLNIPITDKVDLHLNYNNGLDIAQAIAYGLTGFTKCFKTLSPDILLVLGDRYEMFAAVCAALPLTIPVAHIHGGESSEGVIDEQIRHATTKLSHIHFPATEIYKQRILSMGENPEHVFCFGAPGVENIKSTQLLTREKLLNNLNINLQQKVGLVTFHPVTLEKDTILKISSLISALEGIPNIYWVFTAPNIEQGSNAILSSLQEFVTKNAQRAKLIHSLGQTQYLSMLQHAHVMVGNSSSGLLEAPSFKLPVVNIGSRQRGRIRANNVIDVTTMNHEKISQAILKAISPEFRDSIANLSNPYEGKNTSSNIVNILKNIPLNEALIKKSFYDSK